MQRNLVTCFFILVFSLVTFSQQSASFTSDLADYNKAKELYNNHQYLAAQALFEKVKNRKVEESIKGDCAYYIANCAVRLNQQNADQLMESFVSNYPTSVRRNDAYLNVANYYFQNGLVTLNQGFRRLMPKEGTGIILMQPFQ